MGINWTDMTTYNFTKCTDFNTTEIVIAIASINASALSTFNARLFEESVMTCWTSIATKGPSEDYYYTPTGNVSDCIIISEGLAWEACTTSLCGLAPAGNNTGCFFV